MKKLNLAATAAIALAVCAVSVAFNPFASIRKARLIPDIVYNANTLPEEQGWTYIGTPDAGPAPFTLHSLLFQKKTQTGVPQFWLRNDVPLDFDTPKSSCTIQAVLKVITSQVTQIGYAGPYPNFRGGYAMAFSDKDGRYVAVYLASNGLIMTTDIENATYAQSTAFFPLDTTAHFYRYKVVIKNHEATLSYWDNPSDKSTEHVLGTLPIVPPTPTGQVHLNEVSFGGGSRFPDEVVLDSLTVNQLP